MLKFRVVVEKTNTGYSAYSDKSLVFTTGQDVTELFANFAEAMNFYIRESRPEENHLTNLKVKLASLRPIIRTDQFDETIMFYTTILGFAIRERNDEWQWASLCKDDVEIMLGLLNEHEGHTKPGFAGSFYFNTTDVDAVWEMLKDKTKICYEPETFDWGMREFAIYDNNGYILQFGQEV